MGLLWGNKDSLMTCHECGMKIPNTARICPYCRSEQKHTVFQELESEGCLGAILKWVLLIGGLMLLSKCAF